MADRDEDDRRREMDRFATDTDRWAVPCAIIFIIMLIVSIVWQVF